MDGYLRTSSRGERSVSRLFSRRKSFSPTQVSPGSSESQQNGFKPRSPIRQSFRNLLSAFKKSSSKNKLSLEVPDTRREDPPTLRPIRRKAAPRLPSLERNQTGRTSTSSHAQSTLWYLCRDSDKLMDSSPWVPCDAIVGTDKVAVTWISALGTPVGYDIDLTRCTDVRSLPFSQLDAREQALLLQRGEEHEYKVFEILFEGKVRERFATLSVRQRAGWINAIWDSVLSSQDAQSQARQEDNNKRSAPRGTAAPASMAPKTVTGNHVPRSLPSIPVNRAQPVPAESVFEAVHEKKLVHSPEPQEDDIATTTRSLSVFRKQRPQPLEQTTSQSSQSSSVTRTSRFSQSTCVTTPDADSISGEKVATMTRGGSRESSRTTNSIIDAYRRDGTEQSEGQALDGSTASTQQVPMMFTTRSRLETIAESLHHLAIQEDEAANKSSKAPGEEHTPAVMVHLAQTVDANHELTTLIHQKLGKFLTEYTDTSDKVTTGIQGVEQKLVELQNSKESQNEEDTSAPNGSRSDYHQLGLLADKLDEVLSAIQSEKSQQGVTTTKDLGQQLAKIINLVKEDKTRRELVAEQQNESVRYLNELNQWFENFVENGTSQFHNLSTGMDKLCKILCGSPEKPGLIHEIRQMNEARMSEMQQIDDLQHTVGNIASLVRRNAESTSLAQVAELLEKHRKDQVALVRYLAETVSEEIRGERLRFVDAMKEATAINVEGHVEQFKKELKREVKTMNEEVGRLHQARQAMQNQIADLFGFYDKHNKQQKNVFFPPQDRPTSRYNQENPYPYRIPRASQFRPLPRPEAR